MNIIKVLNHSPLVTFSLQKIYSQKQGSYPIHIPFNGISNSRPHALYCIMTWYNLQVVRSSITGAHRCQCALLYLRMPTICHRFFYVKFCKNPTEQKLWHVPSDGVLVFYSRSIACLNISITEHHTAVRVVLVNGVYAHGSATCIGS